MRKFYFQADDRIVEVLSLNKKTAYITFGLENFESIEEGKAFTYLGENYLETAKNYGLINDLILDNDILLS